MDSGDRHPMPRFLPRLRVRRARPAEASRLAALQKRSARHWGYPPGFFAWAPGAMLIPDRYVGANPVYLLEAGSTPLGFYAFTRRPDGGLLLDKLFVERRYIGTGLGRTLWLHAVGVARELGRQAFTIGSDPNAAPFYARMGATWTGATATPNPAWTVQHFRYAVPPRMFRPAIPGEAGRLHDLTQRSTMVWGYEPEFLEWEPEAIAVTPELLATSTVRVLEEGDHLIGYYALTGSAPELQLDKLFVDPAWFATGRGKALWRHAVETARSQGATALTFWADPNAAPFYRAMGATWIGQQETSWPGWTLHRFRVELAS